MKSFRRKKYKNGWMLEQFRETRSAFILTMPPGNNLLAKTVLSTIPGSNRNFIFSDIYKGEEVFFTSNLTFNEVYNWCSVHFSLTPTESKKRIVKPSKSPICQLTPEGEYIRDWSCISEASKTLNINTGNIFNALNKKQEKAGGFRWEYK